MFRSGTFEVMVELPFAPAVHGAVPPRSARRFGPDAGVNAPEIEPFALDSLPAAVCVGGVACATARLAANPPDPH